MRIRDFVVAFALALVPPPSCGDTTGAPSSSTAVKNERETAPPPGYKGTNEGAQGRINATEDHARAGESPTNERRP